MQKPNPFILGIPALLGLAVVGLGLGYFVYAMANNSMMAEGAYYEAPPAERAPQTPYGKFKVK